MLLKSHMLLGNATVTVVSLCRSWERWSCFLLPPPHSHFSLHNLDSIYFMIKAKRKRHPVCQPSVMEWRLHESHQKQLEGILSVFRKRTQTPTNLGKLLQEIIYWGGGIAEVFLKGQKYKTQYLKHLILKKYWCRGCQRASGATEGRKAIGADSLFSRESVLTLFCCHQEN